MPSYFDPEDQRLPAFYQDDAGNNLMRSTYAGSRLKAEPRAPLPGGTGVAPSYATLATMTTLPDYTYQNQTLLNFGGRQGYDVDGTFQAIGESGEPDMELYDQQGREMFGDDSLTREQLHQRIGGLHSAFPNFNAKQYQALVQNDPNVWQGGPNSQVPETMIPELARHQTSYGPGFDPSYLSQMQAYDQSRAAADIRRFNQTGRRVGSNLAPILNGMFVGDGEFFDARQNAFIPVRSGQSAGSQWDLGLLPTNA